MRDVRQRNLLLVLGLLLLPAIALPLSWLRAQAPQNGANNNPAAEILRFSRNIPGDTKTILLAADSVFAWTQGNDQHFLLKGQVFIQQGVFQMRAQEAVVFVDMAAYKARGICRAEIYAEGGVFLDNSNEKQEANRAAVELNTRGEIKVHSGRTRLSQQNMAQDALVGRGRAQRQAIEIPRLQPKPPVTPVPYGAPGMGGASGTPVSPASHLAPLAPGPASILPPVQPPPAGAGLSAPLLPPSPTTGPGFAPLPPLPTLAPVPPARSAPGGVALPPADGPLPGMDFGELQPAGYQNTSTQPAPALEQAVSATPSVLPAPEPEIVVTQQPLREPLPPGFAPDGGVLPLPPPAEAVRPPQLPPLSLPELIERRLAVSPRSSAGFGLAREMLPTGEQALIVTGGVILNIRGVPKVGLVDLEADRLVIISKKIDPQNLFNGMREPQGAQQNPDVELYLAGNVEIRQPGTKKDRGETRTIRADEVYYDVKRNVAIALRGTLEIRDPTLTSPIVAHAERIVQTSTTTFEMVEAEVFASKLPSDPGLKLYVSKAIIEERKVPRLGLFGQAVDRKTGQPLSITQTWVQAQNVWFELQGVPIFYSPYLAGDARDPFGPVDDIRFGYNRVFGAQLGTTLNVYDLLGVQPLEGTRWKFLFDYMSYRGFGLGSDFTYANQDPFGIPSHYEGAIKSYGIYDNNEDLIGGFRPDPFAPPDFRGRFTWRHGWYDLPYGLQFQSQLAYQSDRNFFEQYFKQEFEVGIPQESFLYLKQQDANMAWTLFSNVRLREWMNETENLPRADGYLLGQTFFDRFVYNSNASAGYFRMRASSDTSPNTKPFAVQQINPTTDVNSESGRVDWWQELAAPFRAGPFNFVPYARLDLTGYSEDLNGNSTGRLIGAGGLRSSLPLSRLDADIQSDLFNLDGLYHKMVFSSNWYYAQSSKSFDQFAQFDRVNLPLHDMEVRQIRSVYGSFLDASTASLLKGPKYDPQIYAIRRLIENKVDTRDDIHVVQLSWTNRWQTKRGFPGSQHIIDWMTLDLSASFFPNKDRDNFGSYFAFLEYDWVWNIGDRTALVSNGWVDPYQGGARVFNFGGFYNRPDGTSFYLGYRNIDPLDSRAVIASASYTFSPKYSGTFAMQYDFGANGAWSQMVAFNRIGTDLTVSLGVNYNSLQNNFGLVFQIVPNLLPVGAMNMAGLGQSAGRGGRTY